LLALSYELLGQDKAAGKLLHQAFALPSSTEFLAYDRRVWPEFLINRGRFEEALAASQEMCKSQWPMARLAGHTLAGQALLSLNRLEEAQQELSLAEQEAMGLPERIVAALPYPAALRGSILLRQNQQHEGESIIVNVEKSTLAMPGPDAWLAAIFILESIARDARAAGDWPLAQYTAEQMIQHDPYYAGGHFAIGLVQNTKAKTMERAPCLPRPQNSGATATRICRSWFSRTRSSQTSTDFSGPLCLHHTYVWNHILTRAGNTRCTDGNRGPCRNATVSCVRRHLESLSR
jgi:hypothetical protein